MKEQTEIKLTDMAFVAFLRMKNVFHRSAEKETVGRRMVFTFDITPEFERCRDSYQNKDSLVEPRAYFDEIRALKNIIYNN